MNDNQETIRVWPADGVLVRDEITRQPIEPGQEVRRTRAIERRIADGDLLIAAPGTEAPAQQPAPAQPAQDTALTAEEREATRQADQQQLDQGQR